MRPAKSHLPKKSTTKNVSCLIGDLTNKQETPLQTKDFDRDYDLARNISSEAGTTAVHVAS